MDKAKIKEIIELAWGESFKLVSYSWEEHPQGFTITATLADKKSQSRLAFFNYHKGKIISSPVAKNKDRILTTLT